MRKKDHYVYTVEVCPPDGSQLFDSMTIFAIGSKYLAVEFCEATIDFGVSWRGWIFRVVTWKNGIEIRKEEVLG